MKAAVYILFLLSGACGLVYEVVWSRMLTQIFGSTVIAVGTVLAAFMCGLALGSYALGKRGDRSSNPLRLYASYELGIGASALVSTLLMGRVEWLYLWLYGVAGGSAALFGALRFVLAFGLVFVPTFLMGATLPLLARFVITRLSTVGTHLSTLYAINTVGAVAGSTAAGFYLIGTFGIHRSVFLAVVCNLGIGLIAWIMSARPGDEEMEVPSQAIDSSPPVVSSPGERPDESARVLLWAFGLAGFTSFAYEIFWTRSLVHLLGNSTYAFTMMLSAFLIGIALGGYLIRFVIGRISDRLKWFAGLQLLIGLSSAAALPVMFSILESEALSGFLLRMSNDLGALMVSRFVTALLIMLVPATMIGALFPLVGSIYVQDLRRTGSDVGKLYAVNTIGNVFGALAPGFVLLPIFGIQKGIVLMAALNVSIGLYVFLLGSKSAARLRYGVPVLFLLAVVVLSRADFDFRFPAEHETPNDRVLYYREGVSGTTKVFEEPSTGEKRMAIDGIVIGGTEFTDYKQQILAHLPKLLLKEFDSELSVGLGSGILLGESLRHHGLERLVCLEIEPSVLEGAAYFEEENYGVLDDPRVEIVIDDASNYLRTTAEEFDIISADEKTADKYASNGFSYSSDYYHQLREHLSPNGLVVQWIPNHIPASQYRMVLRTFAESFPHVTVWYFPPAGKGGPANTIVTGSVQELEIDLNWMNKVLQDDPEAFDGWRKYGIANGEEILAHYISDRSAVLNATIGAKENTLEHPYYEFYSPRDYSTSVNARTLESHDFLMILRAADGPDGLAQRLPGPVGPRLSAAIEAEYEFLLGLRKELQARPHEEVAAAFEAALTIAPWNANLRSQILSYLWTEAGKAFLAGYFASALYRMREAAEVYPENGEVRYYYGLTLLNTGQPEQAIQEMKDAILRNPRLIAPRRHLASQYLANGRFEDAAIQLQGVLVIDPEDLFSLVTYAALLAEKQADFAAAGRHLEVAEQLAPGDPSVIDARAWVAHLSGDRNEARRIVEEGGSYYLSDALFEQRRKAILGGAP